MTCPRHEHSLDLVELVDRAARVGLRQLDGVGDDGQQHGIEVERRADRLADFAQRAHFLDRARERLGARLDLLEQAHVLDAIIAITAWSAKVLSSSTCASGKDPAVARATQITPTTWPSRTIGTAEPCAAAAARGNAPAIIGVGEDVAYMFDGTTRDARAVTVSRSGASGTCRAGLENLRARPWWATKLDELAVKLEDSAEERTRRASTALRDGVEDGLRRPSGESLMTLQDLARRRLLLRLPPVRASIRNTRTFSTAITA